MQVKFLRTIFTFFGNFYANEVYDLTQEQVSALIILNPDDFEWAGEKDAD